MPKTISPILALDPGLRDLGYAVLSGQRLLTANVLNLRHVPPRQRCAAFKNPWKRGCVPIGRGPSFWSRFPSDRSMSWRGSPPWGRLLRRTRSSMPSAASHVLGQGSAPLGGR